MRVAFFGSSNFSRHVLQALADSRHEIAIAITQADSPAGRGMHMRPTPLSALALELGIPVLKPARLRANSELRGQLGSLRLDALAVASYGNLIPQSLLALTVWPLNVHPSPLPLLRGASPLRSTLLLGWKATEVCIMRMTARIDDGPVLARAVLGIEDAWNYADLETASGKLGGQLLSRSLDAIASGTADLKGQDEAAATYCQTFTRADTEIDWQQPAELIHSFIRAWDPDLGSVTRLHSLGLVRKIKIWKTAVVEVDGSGRPGLITGVERSHFVVQTGQGRLAVLELQPENKPRMTSAQFLAGNRLKAGDSFEPAANLQP